MTPWAQLPKIYLKPGELAVNEQPAEITTVLGSCVAVTFYSPRHLVGAICHAMLPRGGEGGGFRYVDGALRYMLADFEQRGIRRDEILVKVFGGSEMFEGDGGTKLSSVGQRNLEEAAGILRTSGLRVTTGDVGGHRGRKLVFHPHTGVVFLKRLGHPPNMGQEAVSALRSPFKHPLPITEPLKKRRYPA